MGRRPVENWEIERVKQLANEGTDIQEIARIVNRSSPTVKRIIDGSVDDPTKVEVEEIEFIDAKGRFDAHACLQYHYGDQNGNFDVDKYAQSLGMV